MSFHTTNYKDTLIEIAQDCPANASEIPPIKRNKTLANIQLELLLEHPYQYTSDDILFECFVQKNKVLEIEKKTAKKIFFSKGQPCLRSSALAKIYGFGFHHDSNGKVAILPMESENYSKFLALEATIKVKAMKNKK